QAERKQIDDDKQQGGRDPGGLQIRFSTASEPMLATERSQSLAVTAGTQLRIWKIGARSRNCPRKRRGSPRQYARMDDLSFIGQRVSAASTGGRCRSGCSRRWRRVEAAQRCGSRPVQIVVE